jgi:DNA-binding transcriptional ArsR family regulator
MSKTTTRRLFAVLVALLVACSFAGVPAVAAAATTGAFGEDADGTLTSGDGTGDGVSDSSSSDDDSKDESSSDDSTQDSSDEEDSTADDSGNDSAENSKDNSTENSSEDNGTGNVAVPDGAAHGASGETVEDTGGTVDDALHRSTLSAYSMVRAVSETTDLEGALGLSEGGVERTGHVGSEAADSRDRTGPSDGGDHAGTAGGTSDADASTTSVGLAPNAVAGSDDDGGERPLPGDLSGGATLGIGALAALAVARSTPLVGSATSGSGSGYLSMLLEKVRPIVFPLRYSRYDDSDPLDHDAREMVYGIVNDRPGSYLSEVSERSGLPLSTTRHHMKVLEREELVSGAKLRGKRRFYPAYAEGIELAAALNDDSTATIIDALTRLGAASVSDLADDLGRDPSTISHHLQRLAEDEIITRERQGRAVMNTLSGEARTALEPETTPRPDEAAEALAD